MSICRIIALLSVTAIPCGLLSAQPKSTGAFFSPYASGISYQHYIREDAFWNFDIGIDYANNVAGQKGGPGFRSGFGYSFIIWERKSDGNVSRISAGPGICLGYGADRDALPGVYCGITGSLGYEYDFSSPVTLSAGITPVLAIHLHSTEDGMQLTSYTNGLLWSLAPQIGIRYRFGSGQRTAEVQAVSRRDGLRRVPRITYGAEWSYIATLNTTYHHNFRALDGYRVNEKGSTMMYNGNGELLAHIGINFGIHYNLALYAGYGGLYEGYTVFPVSLRNTWLFGDSPEKSRWLCFIDAGAGIRPGDRDAITGKAGFGYRLSLSRSVKLDLLLAYRFSYAETSFCDPDGPVPDHRIMRNNNYLSALNLGIGITL